MAHLKMIFPARNLHLDGVFHGYVSHNQMVKRTKTNRLINSRAGQLPDDPIGSGQYRSANPENDPVRIR